MRDAKMKSAKVPKWKPLPDFGSVMTVEDFYESCDSGMFDDEDGFGNYAVADKMSNIGVAPSRILEKGIDKRFTHVVWFNK